MVTKIVSRATSRIGESQSSSFSSSSSIRIPAPGSARAHRLTGHVRLAEFLNFVNILSNHLALT
jgi:hypothetical protein